MTCLLSCQKSENRIEIVLSVKYNKGVTIFYGGKELYEERAEVHRTL